MQTILGANGQIGQEIALHLHREFTQDIRVVSRRPEKVNPTDQTVSADLMDPAQTEKAIAGSEIVFFTTGLPMDTKLWQARWPVLMANVLGACGKYGAKLVFFDNTYMYPQTSTPQSEETPFKPYGEKGKVRAVIANQLLKAMAEGQVEALVCRAPEFYGPGKTQSITNATVIENLLDGKPAKVFLRDDTLRTLIYTPDASRATALLGNTPEAYGETWHLPCDDNRRTYRQFVELAARVFETKPNYIILKRWHLRLAGLLKQQIRDAAELLPRYEADNIFVSDKFKTRFPEFKVTAFEEGLTAIRDEYRSGTR